MMVSNDYIFSFYLQGLQVTVKIRVKLSLTIIQSKILKCKAVLIGRFALALHLGSSIAPCLRV